MPGRARDADATRDDLISAARRRFAADGYERTTIRAVAGDVGVDAALVIRYFGTKEGLFTRAADLDLRLPDLTGVRAGDLSKVLVDRFFAVWEDDGTFLALLRAAATNEVAAEAMRAVFATQVGPGAGRGHRRPRAPSGPRWSARPCSASRWAATCCASRPWST